MNINGLLWVFYLGFSPVYWVPVLSVNQWSNIKVFALLAAIALTWFNGLRKNNAGFPRGIFGVGGLFLLLICSIPAFFQAEFSWGMRRTYDLFFGFGAMWSFYVFWRINENPGRVLIWAALVIAALSLLTISSNFSGFPSWRSPAIFEFQSLSTAGFGALRTGWSNALSLYVGGILLLMAHGNQLGIWRTVFCFCLISIIIGSQLVVAGRAGILSSLFAVGFISWFFLPRKLAILMIIVAGIMVSYLVGDELLNHLRLNRILDASDNDSRALDHFSAGRITTYLFAIEKWIESPIIGHGYGQVEVVKGHDIHNLWLRILAEGGIFLFGSFLYFCYKAVKKTPRNKAMTSHLMRKIPRYQRPDFMLWVIICQGLIMSMLEPRILLGSFQVCAMWWVAVGALQAQYQKYKYKG
jgi:O-antigen ligase